MLWTKHWILIGLSLWIGPSTHRKCLFVPSSTISCRTGCVCWGVGGVSTVIISRGICACMHLTSQFSFFSWRFKEPLLARAEAPLNLEWDQCASNKGLPPHTGSGGAAERERALPLPPPFLQVLLLPRPPPWSMFCLRNNIKHCSRSLPLPFFWPSRKCSLLCLHNRGPLSRQSHPMAPGKRESPDFICSHLWSGHPSQIDREMCLHVYMGERFPVGAKRERTEEHLCWCWWSFPEKVFLLLKLTPAAMEEELDVLLFKSPPSFPIVPFGFGTYLFAHDSNSEDLHSMCAWS